MTTKASFLKINPILSELPETHPCLMYEPHKSTFTKYYHLHGLYKPEHRKTGEEIYYQIYLGKGESNNAQAEEPKVENQDMQEDCSMTTNDKTPTYSLQSLKDYPHLDKLRGIVVFIHGYADHSSRGIPFIGLEHFCDERNLAYVGMDHEGHGLTHGTRCLVKSIKLIAQDISCLLKNRVQQDFSDAVGRKLPIILIGHSMGGLISNEILRIDSSLFACAILSAPLVVPSPEAAPPRIVQRIVQLAVGIPGVGNLPLIKGNKGQCYTNPEHDKDFLNDPLTYAGNMRLGTGVAMLESMESFTDEDYKRIASSLPCLVQHADKDRSCDVSGAHRLGECGYKKIIYRNNDHDLFREPCREEMLRDMHAFIDENLDRVTTVVTEE